MAGTILRLGWTDPRTGIFGAHPQLGGPLDLNDGVTLTLMDGGLELSPPPREVALAGNVRSRGERAARALYRRNRQVRVGLILGPMASYADLAAVIRSLVAWVDAPPATPVALLWQAPGAASPVYLDIVGAAHSIPADERDWLRLQVEPVELLFSARPGLRGDRVTLQNLAMNPGFEAPSGPGVTVFSDPFATLNAYTALAGAAPNQSPANTYVDALMANGGASLARYYRLDEASGTLAYDSSGAGATATVHGGPTQGAAGLLAGDSDTCMTFAAASSQYISAPMTGLPTGNAAFSYGAWFKFAANPPASTVIMGFGGAAAKAGCTCWIDTAGKLNADLNSGTGQITSASAVTTGVAHCVIVTWDGTTLTLYLDGVSVGTSAPGALALVQSACNIGANNNGNGFYTGQIDEACYWTATLSSAQVTAIYNAGHAGATGAVSAAMSIPSGVRLSFGSPAWGAINTWQARLRWMAGGAPTFYLHYTSASDYLAVTLSGATLALVHSAAGTATTLASAAAPLTHEAWYWLQVTQFPTVPGNPALVAATLLSDASGAAGALVATAGPAATADAITALSGQPQIAASGAALVIGGLASGAGHQVSLFGPGGWMFQAATAGASPTGMALGAWERAPANTYPGGPVSSGGGAHRPAAGGDGG